MQLARLNDCAIEHLRAVPGFDVLLRSDAARIGTIVEVSGQAARVHMHDTGLIEMHFGNALQWC